jgi:hypothetical protein
MADLIPEEATECTCEYPYPVGIWEGHHPNCALEQPPDNWCNCQAIPGTVNYPGPWHPKGDPVGCLRFGRASVLRGEGQT